MSDLLLDQLRASVALLSPPRICDGCKYKSDPAAPAPPRCQNIYKVVNFAKACDQVEACSYSPIARRKIAP